MQSINHGNVTTFKSCYTHYTFIAILDTSQKVILVHVTECWKSHSIANCITYTKESVNMLSPWLWRFLAQALVKDFQGFPIQQDKIKKTFLFWHLKFQDRDSQIWKKLTPKKFPIVVNWEWPLATDSAQQTSRWTFWHVERDLTCLPVLWTGPQMADCCGQFHG